MEKTELQEDYHNRYNINYPQELNGQGLVFYSRHEEAGGSDYDEELIDYTEDDLILDDVIPEDEYEVDEDEEVDDDDDSSEELLQNFYPNGTVIKFKCSQTKPTQFASWEIRFVLLTAVKPIKHIPLQGFELDLTIWIKNTFLHFHNQIFRDYILQTFSVESNIPFY